MKVSAILLLAGLSTRFDSLKSKQVCLLNGKPVFTYPLDTLSKNKKITNLVVVVNKDIEAEVKEYIVENNISCEVTLGGKTRQESVSCGLKFCSGDIVVIHDGARPLIDDIIINEIIKSAEKYGASTTYIVETDTVVKMDKNECVEEFLNRDLVAKIQTPQAFKTELIKEAHEASKDNKATDDATLVKNLGHTIKLVLGSKKLTKITTIEDIKYLEGLLK